MLLHQVLVNPGYGKDAREMKMGSKIMAILTGGDIPSRPGSSLDVLSPHEKHALAAHVSDHTEQPGQCHYQNYHHYRFPHRFTATTIITSTSTTVIT